MYPGSSPCRICTGSHSVCAIMIIRMVGYNFVSSQLKDSVHAVCIDAYLVLGCPDRRTGSHIEYKLKNKNWGNLGRLGEGLEDSDLARNV